MRVKICGLSTNETVDAAVAAGAHYIGFVFFEKSPRHVSLAQASKLATRIPNGVTKTALVVNASDHELDQITDQVPLDLLQLHGSENPARVEEVKARYGLPVMKAIGISDANDLDAIDNYAPVVDQLLIDAKPPKDGNLPGGNGLSFDWRLIADREWSVSWMLAGGLQADNVAEAIRLTGASQLDVSSGVESAPGVKSSEMIADFIKAAKTVR